MYASDTVSRCALLVLLVCVYGSHQAGALTPLQDPSLGSPALVELHSSQAVESSTSQAEEAESKVAGGDFYHAALLPLAAVTAVLAWSTRPRLGGEALPEGFWAHQWRFIAVWAPAIAADWLQGPYVYALYSSYGYSSDVIAQLFVAGFGSSMIFGVIVGSTADTWGRKRCAVLYCVLYGLSCLTKHSNQFGMLIVGRILGGIATSLLFSTFECWMVAEHRQKRGFSQGLLRYMFGLMFFVQYLMAIMAGLVAQSAADLRPLTKVPGFETVFYGGNTAPFDLSLLLLTGTAPLICYLWDENKGDESAGSEPIVSSLAKAVGVVRSSWRVATLCVVVASFEGSMFAFVFNWTPALESETVPPPYGLIFSAFMMACMCGSSIFSLLDPDISPATCLTAVFGLAAIALGAVTHFAGSSHLAIIFAAFLIFEFCVGLYFPAMGSLKADLVPEEARAGVYNIFRVPLNAVVVCLLLTQLSLSTAFGLCGVLVTLAALVMIPLCWSDTKGESQPLLDKA